MKFSYSGTGAMVEMYLLKSLKLENIIFESKLLYTQNETFKSKFQTIFHLHCICLEIKIHHFLYWYRLH